MRFSNVKKILKPHYHKILRLIKGIRRIGLKNRKLSILCNNCCGGYLYQYFGLPYKTPTIGLFFTTDDFIKICKNPQYYFSQKLEFINPRNSKNYELLKNSNRYGEYPVGKINDLEIFFMHYHSNEEAEKKWCIRSKRLEFDNLLCFLTENELTSSSQIDDFCSLTETQTICLTYNKYFYNNSVFIEKVGKMKIKAWHPKIIVKSQNWKKIFNDLLKVIE